MKKRLEADKKDSAQSVSAFVQTTRDKVSVINQKLQRLLDGYLDQLIDQETYKSEKNKLTSSKKSLEENLLTLERTQTGWIVSLPHEEIRFRVKYNTGEPAMIGLGRRVMHSIAHRSSIWFSPVLAASISRLGASPK
ncbi:MAG: hypothetical protein ACD_40C00258G0001 [uncultured bacterium]|nr:MAG: hypothetical protein ACD_40C00258G0001 [uncultured bacterium]